MYGQILDLILYAMTCLHISTKRWLMFLLLELSINYVIQIIKGLLDNPQQINQDSGTTRYSKTTKSLDDCIGPFHWQVASRDTISTVLNGEITGAGSGEYGNASYTTRALINAGAQRVFNNSRFFARNGSSVKTGTWYAGSVKLISETPLQIYNVVAST